MCRGRFVRQMDIALLPQTFASGQKKAGKENERREEDLFWIRDPRYWN